nr:MAG TPA: hypothetical protein [Caudoviricetes sp.]
MIGNKYNVVICAIVNNILLAPTNHEHKKTMDPLEFRHLANESQYQIDKITSKSRANQPCYYKLNHC